MMGRDMEGADGAYAARAPWRICSTCSALTTVASLGVWAGAAQGVASHKAVPSSGVFIGMLLDRPCFDAGGLARHIPAMTQPPLWKASVALTKAEAADT